MNPKLIVLQGPSASGKSTLQARLGLPKIVTWTSREPREGETDGVDYAFKSRTEMEERLRGGMMVEMTEYHGNYYGTPLSAVEDAIRESGCRTIVLDRAGAATIRRLFKGEALLIGVKAERSDCERRLALRGHPPDEIADRMSTFDEEIDALAGCDAVLNNTDDNLAKTDLFADWIRLGLEARG